VPVLGEPVALLATGFGWGHVAPCAVYNGGDLLGSVEGLVWSSWGGPEAVGSGEAGFLKPGLPLEPIVLVAYDLGICDGILMYQALEGYYPDRGQHFDPTHFQDVCTGQSFGS
jgi:hypothetical protein